MESKIRVLSDHTINKIAAGEVIENPSSVVKELVENSLDAGATEVCIEIRGGGRDLIRVSDNGFGMSQEDALLSLQRHATSKISDVDQIQDVLTMGFRGEAIPSIASISKFNLTTKLASLSGDLHGDLDSRNLESLGTMVIVDGGKIISSSPTPCSVGTSIEVKSLFFNVPVRKKFMKSPSIDASEILKVMSMMSLGYPEIKFHLISDGKTVLSTLASHQKEFSNILRERIGQVLGEEFIEQTRLICIEENGIRIEGVVGVPDYTRHNRSSQYLFINRRAVVSQAVVYGVKDGYGTALATGRHPVFVLHLTLPGEFVDVNVHPQKKEVRLRRESVIRDLIRKGMASCLHQNFRQEPKADFMLPKNVFNLKPEDTSPFQVREEFTFNRPLTPFSARREDFRREEFSCADRPGPAPSLLESDADLTMPPLHIPQGVTYVYDSWPEQLKKERDKESLFVLATIPRYILLDGSRLSGEVSFQFSIRDGLVLIDQRAAHMRILYEEFLEKKSDVKSALQILLIPYVIEVSLYEASALLQVLPLLNEMGISIKEVGPRSFAVEAIAKDFGNSRVEMLIADIIRDVQTMHREQLEEKLFQKECAKRLAIAAGRAAVGHDSRLSLEEAKSIVDRLFGCQEPRLCPLGKPIILHLKTDELVKLFQRSFL